MSQVPSGEWRGSLGDNLLIEAIILLDMVVTMTMTMMMTITMTMTMTMSMIMTMTMTMTNLTKAGTSRLQELVEGKVSCCRVEVSQCESAG